MNDKLINAMNDFEIKDLKDLNMDDYDKYPVNVLESFGKELSNEFQIVLQDTFKNFMQSDKKDIKKAFTSTISKRYGVKLNFNGNNNHIKAKSKAKVKNVKGSDNISNYALATVVLAVVNAKLSEIIEREKMIIDFLETDKETKMKADYSALVKIAKEYPYNYDNDKFLYNREMLTVEIKKDAEHNMLFYQEMTKKEIKSYDRSIVGNADKGYKRIINKFLLYRTALYIYAYSSFMDIILLENYSFEYIDAILKELDEHVNNYNEFFNQLNESINHLADSSSRNITMKESSKLTNFVSGLLGKMKAEKQSEKLKDKSIKIEEKRANNRDRIVSSLSEYVNTGIEDVIKSINDLKSLYNNNDDIIVSDDYVYVKKVR